MPLSPDFAGPQLGDVLAREHASAIVFDDRVPSPVVDASGFAGARIVGWHERGEERDDPTLAELVAGGGRGEHGVAPAPRAHGSVTMLTSGTTGTPKGAKRTVSPRSLVPLAVGGRLGPGTDPQRAPLGRPVRRRATAVSPVRPDRLDRGVRARLADRDPPPL